MDLAFLVMLILSIFMIIMIGYAVLQIFLIKKSFNNRAEKHDSGEGIENPSKFSSTATLSVGSSDAGHSHFPIR